MSRVAATHCFLGPSLPLEEARAILPEATFHPPIAHGDLRRLPIEQGDRVLIADGFFYQRPPVRHREITEVIELGAAVVGAASMGALRAVELRPFGMGGVGAVHRLYARGVIDGDDEVALLHGSDEGWRPLTEALVNVRATLRALRHSSALDAATELRLVEHAQSLALRERAWPEILAPAGDERDRLLEEVAQRRVDLKAADVRLLLRLARAGRLRTRPPRMIAEPTVYQAEWQVRHSPLLPAARGMLTLNAARLLDPRFPEIRQGAVLRELLGAGEPGEPLQAAGRRAAAAGTAASTETLASTALLSDRERAELTEDELQGLLVVRSWRLPGGQPPDHLVMAALAAEGRLEAAAGVAAQAAVFNRLLQERRGPGVLAALSRQFLLQELERRWAGEPFPVACARRGLLTEDEAVAAGRELVLFVRQLDPVS